MRKSRVREKEADKVSMTVRLPRPIYEQARKVVESRVASPGSLNELIVAAVRSFVTHTKRRQIDLAFRGMAGDADFQTEAQRVASQFEDSDWDALRLTEKT